MTNYIAEPDGYNIKVGHNICEESLSRYYKIKQKKNFTVAKTQTLTSGQNVTSIQITELKSSESEIYWIESVHMLNDVHLWMQFRDKQLFGTNTKTYIDMNMANMVSPFNLNQWMYNYTPTMEMTEQASLAVTASIKFSGIIFSLERYRPDNQKDKKVIDLIEEGRTKCWSVQG